jgi:trans-AT polyketide synthase/acyltransferase/oxidoreductase domain-containing protein
MEAPRIAEILIENQLDRLDVANYNSPDQTVISGPSDLIADAQPIFEAAGVRAYIPLKVSAPFHSRYMQSAAEEFRAFLKGFTLRDPQIPVYANCTAEPYGPGEMIDLLPQQIASPVRWNETINKFLDLPAPEFTEVGPGRVLTGLLAKIRKARG